MTKDTTHDEEPTDDQDQIRETAARAAESTARVGGGLAKAFKSVWLLFATFGYLLLNKTPKTGGLADGLFNAAHKMKLKATGADVICNVIYPDGVVIPRAAWWQSDESAYLTDRGEKFSAKGIGFDPKRLNGKFPVVWALREGSEITEPLEAYMGTQRRVGNWQTYARSDGGQDIAVDAVTPGADGRALSYSDGWRLFGSKITQEDMNLQAQRAKLAELDGQMSDGLKMVLVGAGGLVLGMFGPALAAKLAGGASGAIGGGIPLGFIHLAPLLGVL